MGVALREGFAFEVRDRRAFIVRSEDGCPVAAVEPIEAHLLHIAAQAGPETPVPAALARRAGPGASEALARVRARLRPLLRDDDAAVGDDMPPFAQLLAHAPGSMRTLPGPKILHWTVTKRCPRQCLYCYAEPEHGSRASDSTLSRERLRALLAEAASLGATGILLSGSEPFLRPDLPEIIGDARGLGLETLLTTKFPISRSLAERLAAAGMKALSLSVDTIDSDLSLALIGSAAYPAQVTRSVRNLKRAGLAFAIQAVLTPQTLARIDDLAGFAAREGAAGLQLVPFEPVRRPIKPIDQADLMVRPEAVERAFASLRRLFPDLNLSIFRKGGEEACDELYCDIGSTKLFFDPAGRVHRCYKLTDDASLFGLDLTTHSIAAAWHDPDFAGRLTPSAVAYAGSACGGCANFGGCNKSGRCIFQAALDHGRYAAPDRSCARSRAFAPA